MLTRNQEKKKRSEETESLVQTKAEVLDTDSLVQNIVNAIQIKNKTNKKSANNEETERLVATPLLENGPKKIKQLHVRGQPKSGRPWKEVKQK